MSDTDSVGYGNGRKPVEEPSSPRIASLAKNTAETLKTEAAGVVRGVQDRAENFAEENKHVGARHAESIARAVHRAADELRETSPELARYTHDAAASISQVASSLRSRSFRELFRDAEDLGRQQPIAVFAMATFAGFAMLRFMKSSSATPVQKPLETGEAAVSSSKAGETTGEMPPLNSSGASV